MDIWTTIMLLLTAGTIYLWGWIKGLEHGRKESGRDDWRVL